MKKNMTYHELHVMESDLEKFKYEHPAICLLFSGTIKRFFETNKTQFEAMYKGMDELRKRFIEVDDDGNLVSCPPDAGGVIEWKYKKIFVDFKSSTSYTGPEAVKQVFNEKLKEFMNGVTIAVII